MNNFSLRYAALGPIYIILLLSGLSGCSLPDPFNTEQTPNLPPYPIPIVKPTETKPTTAPPVQVPQPKPKPAPIPPATQSKASIAQANQLLKQGRKREAADMYFRAAFSFQSPQRERIILQAAELTASQGDQDKTNAYLKRIDRNLISRENQVRYRYIQSLLALHSRNPRLALQLTPSDPSTLSPGLRKKVILVRQRARQMQFNGNRPPPPTSQNNAAPRPPNTNNSNTTNLPTTVNKVAVLLPQSGSLAKVAKEIYQGIQDQQVQYGPDTRTKLYPVTRSNVVNQYTQAVNDGADMIIGPLSKESLSTLLAQPAILSKPILSLNYLQNQQQTPGILYQFGLSPEDEARQIARFAINRNQTRAIMLTADSLWGQRLASAFTENYQQQGGQIIHAARYSNRQPSSYLSIVRNALNQGQGAQMVFLAASPTQARLLRPLLQSQAGLLPIYATSHIFSGKPNPQDNVDLDGIIYTEIPLILDNSQKNRITALNYPRLYALGADALLIAKSLSPLARGNATLPGKTGQVRLGNNRAIQRSLSFATFINGVPSPLNR